jgi:hypothetical protein
VRIAQAAVAGDAQRAKKSPLPDKPRNARGIPDRMLEFLTAANLAVDRRTQCLT